MVERRDTQSEQSIQPRSEPPQESAGSMLS